MRLALLALLCLSVLLVSGCKMFDPNSRLNPNRGEYHDEGDLVGKEGRGDQSIDPATLPVYAPQLTATVACDSGPRWLDTTTSAPLPVGAGCPSGALCREGTCYPAP